MGSSMSLSTEQTRRWLLLVCQAMIGEESRLTRADQAVGDGDHGVGMSRGFKAVASKLDQSTFSNLGELFGATGRALLMSVGGAAGAIFGSLFIGGAKSLGDRTAFDAAALADLLDGGLRAVQDRGKANVGDKTIVDALKPAADKARAERSQPLVVALAAVVGAASDGLESTRGLQARLGKARALGERALGHVDPGALSFTLILEHLARLLGKVARAQP